MCHNTRRVWSETLGKEVRCTACTTRQPPKDPTAFKALIAAETKRWNMTVARAVSLELLKSAGRRDFQPTVAEQLAQLSDELLNVDRIMQRWAVGNGSGLPWTSEEEAQKAEEIKYLDDAYTTPAAKPPPLDDVTQTTIDLIVQHRYLHYHLCHGRHPVRAYCCQCLIHQWYCQPIPCATMAEQRGLTIAGLLLEYRAVLGALATDFLRSGHEPLIRMVKALP